MIARPSPNADDRPTGGIVDILLLHYTGMQSAEASLDRLCDATAKVSAHYLIDEGGTVFGMVDEGKRAWHAGVSFWAGATDINARSIGIELQNPGHEFGYRAFPDAQMAALTGLCQEILSRHRAITPERVLGHSDVAPTRKQDPGELFDWQRLADASIGRIPFAAGAAMEPDDRAARALLSRIGYDPNAMLSDVITAFQRRYRQRGVDGHLDAETMRLISAVAAFS
jgi:N-acetylmuramoyl-L-alanine amidase